MFKSKYFPAFHISRDGNKNEINCMTRDMTENVKKAEKATHHRSIGDQNEQGVFMLYTANAIFFNQSELSPAAPSLHVFQAKL